jgi:hypothetical protein
LELNFHSEKVDHSVDIPTAYLAFASQQMQPIQQDGRTVIQCRKRYAPEFGFQLRAIFMEFGFVSITSKFRSFLNVE